uniref:Uncharacterized protein n=1 Tax=Spumella elongata TaxID=89044 RepID=A0A7S3HM56_9STRA
MLRLFGPPIQEEVYMSYSVDGSDANSRKRLRRTKESADGMENAEHFVPTSASVDEKLFDVYFPKHLESNFAAAIFELGLKHSSPKILMPLMPNETNLSTEHIKSHLQKYRIHRQRSKDEFFDFYNNYMKDAFQQWENAEGWKHLANDPPSSSSLHNNLSDNGLLKLANGCELDGGAFGDEQTERDDASKMSATVHAAAVLDANVEQVATRYAKEILQETESLLLNVQALCQEVVESGDALKRKPEVQRSSVRLH